LRGWQVNKGFCPLASPSSSSLIVVSMSDHFLHTICRQRKDPVNHHSEPHEVKLVIVSYQAPLSKRGTIPVWEIGEHFYPNPTWNHHVSPIFLPVAFCTRLFEVGLSCQNGRYCRGTLRFVPASKTRLINKACYLKLSQCFPPSLSPYAIDRNSTNTPHAMLATAER